MTKEEIRALLNDIESDRVERTVSTTNTDKFGQAICAFANDLPDYRLPGYLFLGVKDDGEVQGLNVTDEPIRMVRPFMILPIRRQY
jgi:ATP-dependent DNA helicase RecG